jgi:CheY-like chemotaxis protein
MSRFSADLIPPRILVVDDERHVHSSLRLRLGQKYNLCCCGSGRDGLKALEGQQFDLCFVDIHMPEMNGLAFIEVASRADPDLGFVLLSAFDSDENLRKAIPLQVYEFIGKPLPEREGFEALIPSWIERTRERRQQHALAERAGSISRDLDTARLEREVELVASESARDALLQTASLLTTIHAHLVSATSVLAARVRNDISLGHLLRSLEEARKTADAAVNVAEIFFDSGYGNRDSSPAMVGLGLRHAVSIASRMAKAEDTNKSVDCPDYDYSQPIRGVSGIDFLLMMIPAIEAALIPAPPNSTVRVTTELLPRIDAAMHDNRFRNYLWINRRHALANQPGVLVQVASNAGALTNVQAEAWLRGDQTPLATVTARGLVSGIQKCRGLIGMSVSPSADKFRMALLLPT